MKKILLPLLGSLAILAACDGAAPDTEPLLSAASPAPADQRATIDLCHKRGPHGYQRLTVAAPSVPAHRDHGDGFPGEDVPGMAGYTFDGECRPQREAEAVLVFDPPSLTFVLDAGGSDQVDVTLDSSDGSTLPTPAALTVTYDGASGGVEWLSVTSAMNQGTPYSFSVFAVGLAPGTYEATVTAGPVAGYPDAELPVTLTVMD